MNTPKITNRFRNFSRSAPAREISATRGTRALSAPASHYSLRLLEELETRMLLSQTSLAHMNIIVQPSSLSPSAVFSPSGFTPAQLRQAYGFNQVAFGSVTGDGTGQTIAIIDAYNAPTIVSDLHAFDQQFGLSDPTLTRLNEHGSSTLPGNDPSGRGDSWALETSLDVEWAHAIAPKATIVLVEATSASDSDLMAAINTARNLAGVSVISMSWGGNESSSDTSLNQTFTTPAGHQGITFLASTGDSGAYGTSTSKIVGFPATSPNVVAVGGTTLSTDSLGNYLSESGWGSGSGSFNNGGSGGGISHIETQPTYQHGLVTQSSSFRTTPDVAFDADPNSGVAIYDSYDSPSNPWIQIGGTSLAAPLWAGLMAVVDQGRALAGQGTLDGATQTLPRLYALPASDFHDITTGNNGYAAGPGYDLVTGRGTPIANRLIPDLVSNSTPANNPTPPTSPTISIGSFTATPGSVVSGAQISLAANNVLESGGSISSVKFYQESNTIAGLQSTDTLIGTGLKNGNTWTLSATTAGVAPGTYTLYALATDASGVTLSSQATLTITAPAVNNNNFANATPLSGTSTSVTGSNIGATKESGEPAHAGNSGGRSVWWSWTAPSSGTVHLNTYGSSFDTLLAVYTGTAVNALTRIASNDDDKANFALTSALSFNAVAGKTYHIAVDGYRGASGTINLNLTETLTPARTATHPAILLAAAESQVFPPASALPPTISLAHLTGLRTLAAPTLLPSATPPQTHTTSMAANAPNAISLSGITHLHATDANPTVGDEFLSLV